MTLHTTTDGTDRTPLRFATYSADVRESIVGHVLGPNTLGEYMRVVEAIYDDETGLTRVGFVFASEEEITAEGQRRLEEENPYGRGPVTP